MFAPPTFLTLPSSINQTGAINSSFLKVSCSLNDTQWPCHLFFPLPGGFSIFHSKGAPALLFCVLLRRIDQSCASNGVRLYSVLRRLLPPSAVSGLSQGTLNFFYQIAKLSPRLRSLDHASRFFFSLPTCEHLPNAICQDNFPPPLVWRGWTIPAGDP